MGKFCTPCVVAPITKTLPLEYAVEFNRLVELEMGK